MGPEQNIETCLKGEAKEAVPMQNIVRRLKRRIKKIEVLYQEVDELYDLMPLTLEVLLIGVLGKSLFHLSEANVVIDHFRPYTLKSLGKGTHVFWRAEFADRIRREVRWHAQDPPVPLDREEDDESD